MSVARLRQNGMMAHLMDALSRGEDIGHYGRLVFAMVARYFLSEDELLKQLQLDPNMDEQKTRALIEQVVSKGYSPPSREKVLEFQTHQEFPICPNPKDPDACNVYKDLTFPTEVYESINEYHVEKAEANDESL
jgi:DNA primase large subunit